MLQMYKTIFVIAMALIAFAASAIGNTAMAFSYNATILTNEMAHVVFNNGTAVDKPLVQYNFSIGPQGIPYSVTMVGQ